MFLYGVKILPTGLLLPAYRFPWKDDVCVWGWRWDGERQHGLRPEERLGEPSA